MEPTNRDDVIEKLARYLQHRISVGQLVGSGFPAADPKSHTPVAAAAYSTARAAATARSLWQRALQAPVGGLPFTLPMEFGARFARRARP
jgi:hypothetical protein